MFIHVLVVKKLSVVVKIVVKIFAKIFAKIIVKIFVKKGGAIGPSWSDMLKADL